MTDSQQPSGAETDNGLQPPLTEALFRYLLELGEIPAERRIFVNRTLRMESIRYVGFDLDWTLADYERLPLERLTFELALDRLVRHHGYPVLALQAEFRPDFPRRGLMIDKQAGTVLRMNRHRFVNLAYFGRDRLGRHELKKLYRFEPIQPSSDRFYHLDSLFELPEANLYAELVELANRHDGPALPSFWRMFEDVRSAIDWVHGGGELKSRVMLDTGRFLKRDPEVALALLRLSLGGRRLILLTNSDWTYTRAICSYLFDELLPGLDSWRDLFDLVLVGSRKPDFFRVDSDFIQLGDRGEMLGSVAVPAWGGIYQHGCLQGLMRLIGEPGERVLYIGDHIYGDIVSSKLESTWRTTLIVKELEEEIRQRKLLRSEIEQGRSLKQRLARLGHDMDHLRDVLNLYQHLLEHGEDMVGEPFQALEQRYDEITRQHRQVRQEEAHWSEVTARKFSPYWGSFFKQGTSKTRFAGQLETYACLYTSRVSNFAYYGSNQYFRVTRDPMMHESPEPAAR